MVKSKNNTMLDKDNSPETHPHKRTRVNDVENTPAIEDNVDSGQVTINNSVATGSATNSTTKLSENASMDVHTDTLPTAPKQALGASQATLAVKTVIPHPTKQIIDDSEVEEYSDALKLRLEKLSEYMNPKANIYALGKLLPTATWGPYRPVNDRSKILCDPATGESLTIWIVGRIAKMWFTKQGRPESQASITILPLSQSLVRQSSLLLAKFSNPALSLNQQKWQNTKAGDMVTEPILFDVIYDARAEGSLKTYTERPLWNLADLKPGDLILLEMRMTRYSKKGEDKSPTQAALLQAIRVITNNKQLSHREVYKEVKAQNPLWYISLKPCPTSNIEALQLIEDHLYPGIYFTAMQHDERLYHPILLEIFGKKKCPRGDIIVVKNGYNFIANAPDFDIDVNELGRTLWWYLKSGREPVTEASERRLMHYIDQSV
ncbi:uncharacterized protein EDB93DRAFT_1100862 [Suillus bovinus]|uniref:uncharacterized protein n=1 Tax=Suillus bovinus TaxID=48563 RepID=UPI001B8871EA|nr:uncharacterized protein EDB93DRAFT_1100862 [Suillus bovinus]KAG2158085.1 hypothetical protein EDB93DRAFT_1100862 [Suillus bovinus]